VPVGVGVRVPFPAIKLYMKNLLTDIKMLEQNNRFN